MDAIARSPLHRTAALAAILLVRGCSDSSDPEPAPSGPPSQPGPQRADG